MAEDQPFSLTDSIQEARQRVTLELRAQAEQIQKLNRELTALQQLHERTEREASQQWDEVTRVATLAAEEQISAKTELENVLGAVRALTTSTIPEQVFEALTEQAARWGVRAAIFDVRGKSAWGAAARGFGTSLPEKALRALIVPLNQDNPFRQVIETAGAVDASADALKRNRNVLDKLNPAPHAPILLLPVRSAGTVAAIFYADAGDSGNSLPVDALKILAEFAGAQVDRLIALSGGFSSDPVNEEAIQAEPPKAPVEEPPANVAVEEAAPAEPPEAEPAFVEPPAEERAYGEALVETPVAAESLNPEPAMHQPVVEPPVRVEVSAEDHAKIEAVAPSVSKAEPAELPVQVALGTAAAVAPAFEGAPTPLVAEPPVREDSPSPTREYLAPAIGRESAMPPTAPAPPHVDISELSEADQKLHKDAKRFAKLLVSEIELYNKAEVADGRKHGDLYKRLKTDIDRSRQTFEKRFGKTLSKEFAYFHDELVRTLAANDSSVLGPEYPGPAE
ncbi:MAG: hypothetical protein ACLQVL_11785 [Terriglobia bacterium]